MPGTIGNLNALRSGRRTDRHGLVLAALGRRHRGIFHEAKRLRAALEAQLRGSDGRLSLVQLAQVNEAVKWEVCSRIAEKAVADAPDLPPAELLTLLRQAADATRNRTAIIRRLLDGKADADPADPLAAILNALRNGQRPAPAEGGLLVEAAADAAESPPAAVESTLDDCVEGPG